MSEGSLGDILQAALNRKSVTQATKVIAFIHAARETGRSDREVMGLLMDDELSLILTTALQKDMEKTHIHIVQLHKTSYHANDFYGKPLPPDYRIRHTKIDDIKQVRSITGWGLKEAKDFVEGGRSPTPVTSQQVSDLRTLFGINHVNIVM